jgi:hypothetical protein
MRIVFLRCCALVLLLPALARCGPTFIVMKNPETGAIAQCQGNGEPAVAARAAQQCAEGYQAAGWKRMN